MVGPKNGNCNICGSLGALTEDHIPPRACRVSQEKKIHHAVWAIADDSPHKRMYRPTRSQNGIKYRTICASCNNNLLGGHLDPEITSFSRQVHRAFRHRIIMCDRFTVQFDKDKLLRCVAGHLAAQGVGKHGQGIRRPEWVDYIMGRTPIPPAGSNFYFAPYPFNEQCVIVDRGVTNILYHYSSIYSVLCFFPVCFVVFEFDDGHASSLGGGIYDITPSPIFNQNPLLFEWSKILDPGRLIAPGHGEIILANIDGGVIAK